jgi:malate dehydrogenase (oxaloacetate-decarboxylating)
MIAEGLSPAEATDRFWIVDKFGLLDTARTALTPEQVVYARGETSGPRDLAGVVAEVGATILIGLSTAAGAFTEEIVREMARKTERPIIFPLSNPTESSEAKPEDLIRWTEGRALVATGSPFPPVECAGRTIHVSQCNNIYIFPAIGLALAISRARRITDAMMMAAARALAENSPALKDPSARLLPPLREARTVAVEIAVAVAMEAQRSGLASPRSEDELRAVAIASQWAPVYPSYEDGFSSM